PSFDSSPEMAVHRVEKLHGRREVQGGCDPDPLSGTTLVEILIPSVSWTVLLAGLEATRQRSWAVSRVVLDERRRACSRRRVRALAHRWAHSSPRGAHETRVSKSVVPDDQATIRTSLRWVAAYGCQAVSQRSESTSAR